MKEYAKIAYLIVGVAVVSACLAALVTSKVLAGRQNRAVASAIASERERAKTETTGATLKLRVCVNQAPDAEAVTSCFRQSAANVLPSPTSSEVNALPDLY